MGIGWRVVKTVSKLNSTWRANIKQYENFHKREHYYSPIPKISEVQRYEHTIFDRNRSELAGIDLNDSYQLQILRQISGWYDELPFEENQTSETAFYLNNKFYPYTDAILYYGIMRLINPTKIVEVGSGFSSAACLAVNRQFFNGSIDCTFIEPDTARLKKLLVGQDEARVSIRESLLQDVGIDEFHKLRTNDILFIDSSHVCKINSDVNHILFNILPSLNSGVYIHFHDIFYPFEYPKEWIYRGVAWNEAYALRAFLQFNSEFEIVAWSDYWHQFHKDQLQTSMPLCRHNSGSFWLRKK